MEVIVSLLREVPLNYPAPIVRTQYKKHFVLTFVILNILLLPLPITAQSTNNPVISSTDSKDKIDKNVIEHQIIKIQQDMVTIKGGSFKMGDLIGENDERPVHKVTINLFKLGRYEVTFAQWDACIADGGCNGRIAWDEGWGRGDRPVINVNWDDAQNFIRWLNQKTGKQFRLPSEAEWEYAARAGTSTNYSWGDQIGNGNANCKGCSGHKLYDSTLPVGSFEANQFGLYDMHGNVWEWVEDCWNNNYLGAPLDGSAWTSGNCVYRVIRGGSYFSSPSNIRSANRSPNAQTLPGSNPGFRLAHD